MRAQSAPFVGRERELERLQTLFRQAMLGHGQLAFITGSPGMGKTELCEQFIAGTRASGDAPLVATGRCLEQTGTREHQLCKARKIPAGGHTGVGPCASAQEPTVADNSLEHAGTRCSLASTHTRPASLALGTV
jgi:hypothetical protein